MKNEKIEVSKIKKTWDFISNKDVLDKINNAKTQEEITQLLNDNDIDINDLKKIETFLLSQNGNKQLSEEEIERISGGKFTADDFIELGQIIIPSLSSVGQITGAIASTIASSSHSMGDMFLKELGKSYLGKK